MRGKIQNNGMIPIDYESEIRNLNKNYSSEKQQNGVTDDVINVILLKDVKDYTDEEVIKIARRKIIDDRYKLKKAELDSFKEIVEIPFDGEIPTGYTLVGKFRENGDVIENYYELEKDLFGINKNIKRIEKELSDGDYRIIKTYEARLMNQPDPYEDMESFIQHRNELRQQHEYWSNML